MRLILSICTVVAVLVGSASTVRADLPTGLQYDDGFAFFDLVTRGEWNNNVATAYWYPSAMVRIVGTTVPNGSAMRFVLKAGSRSLGEMTCPLRAGRHNSGGGQTDRFEIFNCQGSTLRLTETGAITIEARYIDDSTDAEHLARTHTIDVRRTSRVRGSGQADMPEYFVNHHAETAAMLIEQIPPQHRSLYEAGDGGTTHVSTVKMYVALSPNDARLDNATLRCSVNGERIEMTHDTFQGANNMQIRSATQTTLEGSRTVPDYMHFKRLALTLPLVFQPLADDTRGYANLSAHPGAWECSFRTPDRHVTRTFRFTVGADGLIAPHPEENAGLSLAPLVHLLDTDIPADSPVDGRTDVASTRAGAFYGRAWGTAEGRAMGARVPQIGEGFPQSARATRAAAAPAAGRRGRSRH